MFHVVATDEQRDFAKDFLTKGGLGNRGVFDGDDLKQLFGLIGQVIVSDLLSQPRPVNVQGFDGGHDLIWEGKRYDVKVLIGTVAWKQRSHSHNLYAKQIHYACDGYIFLHYDSSKSVYTICGHILKHDFLNAATFFKGGSTRPRTDGTSMVVREPGMYEIRGTKLDHFKKEDFHGKHRFV